MPAKPALSSEERQYAIEGIKAWMAKQDMSQGRLGKMAGVGASTVNELLTGKDKGDVDAVIHRVQAAISEWFRRREAPAGVAFVRTDVAERIFTVIKTTAKMGGMGVIYGPSAIGKTMTLQAASEVDFPSAILIEADPRCASPLKFCRAVLAKLSPYRRIGDGLRTVADAFDLIVDRLRGSGRLILVDEADVLAIETFNLIRQIHDKTGCPIVLVGRPNLARKIARTANYDDIGGSVRSRLDVEHNLMSSLGAGRGGADKPGAKFLFSSGEVREILAKFKVRFTDEAVEWLTMLANASVYDGQTERGGLRIAVKLFRLAAIVARQREVPVTVKLLRSALALTRDEEWAVIVTRQVDELLRKQVEHKRAAV